MSNERSSSDLGSLSLNGKPESLTEAVYSTILDAIVTRVLQPGQRVTEAAVAERLGVSKTPVREAFVRLREIGLIQPHGGRGSQIVPQSGDALLHAYEMRAALESFTAEMAAARADDTATARIAEAATESLRHAEAGDLDGFRSWDRVFHRAIAGAAANPRVPKAIDDAVVLIMALRQRDMADLDNAVGCGHAHVRIADAIRTRDGENAARLMSGHIKEVARYVLLEPPSEHGSAGAYGASRLGHATSNIGVEPGGEI